MDWYIFGSVVAIIGSLTALGVSVWMCCDLRGTSEVIRDMRRFGRTGKG